jgi:hypothetical protein
MVGRRSDCGQCKQRVCGEERWRPHWPSRFSFERANGDKFIFDRKRRTRTGGRVQRPRPVYCAECFRQGSCSDASYMRTKIPVAARVCMGGPVRREMCVGSHAAVSHTFAGPHVRSQPAARVASTALSTDLSLVSRCAGYIDHDTGMFNRSEPLWFPLSNKGLSALSRASHPHQRMQVWVRRTRTIEFRSILPHHTPRESCAASLVRPACGLRLSRA